MARIAKDQYADLSGKGAAIVSGRWNSKGRAVVYTAACVALAVLEYSVHIGSVIPTRLKLLRIEIPDSLGSERVLSIPTSEAAFRQHGDEWLESGKTPLLYVPSILAPGSWNVLINPAHPDAASIVIKEQSPFVLDARLISSFS